MPNPTNIFSDVRELPQVGPKRAEALNDLGIESIYDLLQHYPFRYEDMGVDDITTLEDKQTVVLRGEVISQPVLSYFGHRKSRLNFTLLVNGIPVPVTFFNQAYYKNNIQAHDQIVVFGRFDGVRKSLVGQKLLAYGNQLHEDGLEPVYPANAKIKQGQIRKHIQDAFRLYKDQIPEKVPNDLKEKYHLLSHQQAIEWIHFPKDEESSKQAVREIKFEELFDFQLKILEKKLKKQDRDPAYRIDYQVKWIRDFIDQLPFEATQAQKRSINEICVDFKQNYGMKRMLQGDVGSGKTVVAAAAIMAAYSAGKQSAIMVPTEILADQHARSLSYFFENFDIKLALLKGSTPQKEKREIYAALKEGRINLLIGTHALIQEPVIFKDLSLVIIDEQHRFGVKQRETLENKGNFTNVLYMTATPIPRSLALTSYGDIEMSILNERPKGRKDVQTQWLRSSEDPQIDRAIHESLSKHQQVYVVNALIEESEAADLQAAMETYQTYKKKWGSKHSVGLLHGKMSAGEKEEVMLSFKQAAIDILVSTSVIEVGVDVPRANLMIIYDADRFGLAQLHQLRGRIGRGDVSSLCILVANPTTEIGQERLYLMTKSQDGFYLSEKDLALRGPGDLFGLRQSGLPKFRMADLSSDYPILEIAREEAFLILKRKDKGVN